MAETIERPASESNRVTVADVLTFARIPLAVLFVVVESTPWRIAILWVAGLSDFVDGYVARRWGSSKLGAFLDPVADKVFTICAFGVVFASGALRWWEVAGVLFRDLAAALAFLLTVIFRRPAAIKARLGGKLVTIGQLLALLAFLLESPLLQPIVWVTGTVAVIAVADYVRVARRDNRPL